MQVTSLANGTDVSSTGDIERGDYETGEEITISWNVTCGNSTVCNSVSINEISCHSCSVSEFAYVSSGGSSTGMIQSMTITADCSNMWFGRILSEHDYLPVVYPVEVCFIWAIYC